MKKYVCTVCGWIYDEAKGDPDNGIARGPSLKICRQTMYARSAAPARMNLKFMKDDC